MRKQPQSLTCHLDYFRGEKKIAQLAAFAHPCCTVPQHGPSPAQAHGEAAFGASAPLLSFLHSDAATTDAARGAGSASLFSEQLLRFQKPPQSTEGFHLQNMR